MRRCLIPPGPVDQAALLPRVKITELLMGR
jgi:hypothetical protein